MNDQDLTAEDLARYEWQLDIPGFGIDGQKRLKNASVMISRCGGLGGIVAYELAAAGVGRLILCHGGNLKVSDLNRQLLMSSSKVGQPRIESIQSKLLDLNPLIDIITIDENIDESNAAGIIEKADVIVDCAPMFEERFAMNHESVKQKKPLVECAMYSLEAQVTTFIPGITGCLRCLYPKKPEEWKRKFPVFGAVSGLVGCIGAMEVIKLISGIGTLLTNTLLYIDTSSMNFRKVSIIKSDKCPECIHT